MQTIKVSSEIIQEARNITDGVYQPIKGFMDEAEVDSVLENMRLASGEIWSMPIVLDIDKKTAKELEDKKEVVITDGKSEFLLKNIAVFKHKKENFVKRLFGTSDKEHPGVARIFDANDYLLGGEAKALNTDFNTDLNNDLYFTPEKTREIFKKNGWEYVVAFQTRNPPHRSHEHLQKTALKDVHGVFINPVIGPKKEGDFRDEHIIGSYEKLIRHYYPENKAHLGTFHTFMRYAGPKEAIFHAIVRKNFGCTHMIIGRDHAGVGDYYGTYDAQNIFDNFSEDELGIKILKYENVSYCHGCGKMMEDNQCDHDNDQKVHLSGTKLREKFGNNEDIPEEFMRKEVIDYLKENNENLFV